MRIMSIAKVVFSFSVPFRNYAANYTYRRCTIAHFILFRLLSFIVIEHETCGTILSFRYICIVHFVKEFLQHQLFLADSNTGIQVTASTTQGPVGCTAGGKNWIHFGH